jgi:putative tricarboxylic transport membrane protein
MNRKDLAGGFFWLLVALVVIEQSLELKIGDHRTPGPGYIPLGVGLVMAGIAGIILVRGAFFSSSQPLALGASRQALKKLGIVLAAFFLFAAFFNFLGFLISTFFFLLLLFKGVEPQGWPKAAIWAGGATLLTYLLFCTLLQCELPRGILGI